MSLLRIKQADGSWENIPAIKGADGVDGKDGAVQYTAGRYIQIDEDTQTINCTVKIGDLVIIDAVPVKDSTNVVSSGGVYDALEAKADKTEIAGLGSEAGFITNSVEDLKNYYKKSETYSQEEVNSLIGNLTRLTLQVVQELPEVGTEHVIYLVPNNESGNNVFEEWIFVQSKWEMIGTTEVDLSNYYTKEEIDTYFQDNLLIYPVQFNKSNNNPAWIDVGSDTEKLFIDKINELYKSGKNVFIISLIHTGDPSVRFNCLVKITTIGTTKTIAFTALPNFTYDSDGSITRRCFGNYSYGGGYTYNSTNDVFVHKSTSGTAFVLFSYSGGGAYVKSEDVLTKTNTTSYKPSSDYHPATKKYVDDKVLDAIPQKSVMPEASADYLDKIYQYIGEDTEEFTKGFFYQCISETAEDSTVTYSWSELKFNTSSSDSEEAIIIVPLEGYFNTLSYTSDKERYSGVTLTANDRQTLTNIVNKYYNGSKFIKEIILQTGSRLYYIQAWGNGTASGGKTILSVTLYPISGADSNMNKDPIALNKFSMCFEGSLGSYTPYFSSSLSYWWTETYCIPYLHKENRIPYTPTNDYNPATKKYVDDAIANSGTSDSNNTNTNNIYEIVSSQNLGTSSSDFWSANDKVLEVMNKYLKGEIDIPSFRITAVGTNTTINSRDMYLRIGSIYDLTYTYFGSHLVIQEVGFEQALMLHSYSMTFTLVQDGTTGDYVLSGSISWDYNRRKVLAEGINASYTPTDDYNPATKKYVDDAIANAGGGSGEGADLSDYYNKEEVDAKVAPLVSATDVLTKTNTTEYTPASAYHPATKQYVDQTVASSGGITEESDPTVPLYVKNITQDMITKWNNAPTEEDVTNAATAAVNGAGFVKSETDPAFKASAAAGIVDTDIENWNAKADLADIDSALITALGGTYSTELASNPVDGSVELTMTEELTELATKISNGVANDKPPRVTLKVTFNGMEENLVFTPTKYDKSEGRCWFKAIVMNTPDSDNNLWNPASFSTATLYAYYLNATNKTLELSYSDITSIHDLNEANWANASASSTEDVPGIPNYSMGLHANASLALTTTLDLAYLNEFHEFKPWEGTNAPTTTRNKLVLGILGNKLCIDWGFHGTSITKGVYQTFTEMMESIKVTDETSDDYGKYILAECFIAPVAGIINVFNSYGQELEHESIMEIFSYLYDNQYDRVYLRGSESGQIIVAQLVFDANYSVNNTLYSNTYRITLEINPSENKALASSTTDLGKIVGMHSLQTFSPVFNKYSYKGLLPKFSVNEDGYIDYVSFISIDQGEQAIWS